MNSALRYLFGLCAVALAATASAQPPAQQVDKLADEVLKDVHNRGAELYNSGDPAGCYRMYQGSLLTIRPFLAHRADARKVLDDGLAEVAKLSDPKAQAYRLHQIIEQVRVELKKSATPARPVQQPKPAPAAGGNAKLSGHITLDGKPLGGAEVTLVSLALSPPLVFTAKTNADGNYAFDKPLPKGTYVVMITGAKVPEKFQTAGTSELRFNIAGGPANGDFALKSK